ncbi:ATP-dependent DNA helicase PIF1-like [Senna tora]|uniref:ATP-dependent DNA helicase n=1 Tax=Senna tora TaxID=362788 RepID=A0A834VYM7_9FABA|nr:ATP-dependent DNA helicase PIF1-like [Senna tora]
MPIPSDPELYSHNNGLIYKELNYDKTTLVEELENLLSSITKEQNKVFDTIMGAVNSNKGGFYFVHGFGGGRIAHSRFCIPLQITAESTCNIKQNSELARILIQAKLIIWDEAPLANRFFLSTR